MNTIDKIMALADEYAVRSNGYGWDRNGLAGDAMQERDTLHAAIVEALDQGDPLAWISDRDQLQNRLGDKPGANWKPLYAAKHKP